MKVCKKLLIDTYPNQETRNRILFLEGVFNVGIELIPQFFNKILSIVGIKSNIKKGI